MATMATHYFSVFFQRFAVSKTTLVQSVPNNKQNERTNKITHFKLPASNSQIKHTPNQITNLQHVNQNMPNNKQIKNQMSRATISKPQNTNQVPDSNHFPKFQHVDYNQAKQEVLRTSFYAETIQSTHHASDNIAHEDVDQSTSFKPQTSKQS